MQVRALNEEGIRLFERYLEEARGGSAEGVPRNLLTDDCYSNPVRGNAEVQERDFDTRRAVARYLTEVLAEVPASVREEDRGLWSWLALLYFDRLCPLVPEGRESVGRSYRYVLSTHRHHYYRHLLWGPYKIFSIHGDGARCLLDSPFGTHGEFSEQLASRQQLIVNRDVIGLVDILYWDVEGRKAKVGATTQRGPGVLRRFVVLMNQLDLTYDLHDCGIEALIELLPNEYNRWLPGR